MFDPYHKWLGIPPKEQPPNHYRLLALALFESDPDVIDAAANRQMAYLQQRATGEHAELAQKLLNEVSAARLILLDPKTKAGYDSEFEIKKAKPLQEDSRPTEDSFNFVRPGTNIVTTRDVSSGRDFAKGKPAHAAKHHHNESRQVRIVVGSIIAGLIPVLFVWFFFLKGEGINGRKESDQTQIGLRTDVRQKTKDDIEKRGADKTLITQPNPKESSAVPQGLLPKEKGNFSTEPPPKQPVDSGELASAQPKAQLSSVASDSVPLSDRMPQQNTSSKTSPLTEQGVVEYGRRYFKVFVKTMSWMQADEQCKQMKGRLACVKNPDEKLFLANLKGEGRTVWVGAWRTAGKIWCWRDYTHFSPDELNEKEPSDGYDYVAYGPNMVYFALRVDGRSEAFPRKEIDGFICEWDSLENAEKGLLGTDLLFPKKVEPLPDILARLERAHKEAKTTSEFLAVGTEAVREAERAFEAGDKENGKAIATIAVAASRISGDKELMRKAALVFLKGG